MEGEVYVNLERAVGFCSDVNCPDKYKLVFLLNGGIVFRCPRCGLIGSVESERAYVEGDQDYFSEVRLDFNFQPNLQKYKETAIVREESLPPGKIYIMKTPMILTGDRALKTAEVILGNLHRHGETKKGLTRTSMTILSFDSPMEDFKRDLRKLEESLKKSKLVS